MRAERLRALRALLAAMGADCMAVTSRPNVRYLTGFTGEDSAAVVTQDAAYVVTDSRFTMQASIECPECEVIDNPSSLMGSVRSCITDGRHKRVAFEDACIGYADYGRLTAGMGGVTFLAAGDAITKMRAAKDEGEVRVMAEAARIADLALRETLPLIGPRTKEHEVASELEYRMRKAGAQGRSFETIVASSFRAALPHGTATDRIIGDDACLVLDFGAIYEGYCSDITRTIFLGDPGPELERIYGIVLAAQEEALKAIKAGVPCRDADAAARGLIAGEGYGDAFWHSLGHGVGLEIHEAPRVSGRSDDVLATGMVITVEPGIYVEGLGGVRTENAVVVLEGGYRDLTGFGKALTRI